MWRHTINNLHAGSNVKSQYALSLIIFTQHGKGHVRVASIHCWQANFRLNKQTWINYYFNKVSDCVENTILLWQENHKLLFVNTFLIRMFYKKTFSVTLLKVCPCICIQIEHVILNASLFQLILNTLLSLIHLSLENVYKLLQCEPFLCIIHNSKYVQVVGSWEKNILS